MTRVAGIDAYRRGWVAIVVEDGRFAAAHAGPRLDALITDLGDVAVVGVDIPIGLPERGLREADALARAFVGPRRNSVFVAAPRAVWDAPDVIEARRRSIELTGQSMSAQAFALQPRILEAEIVAQADGRVREIHPEVSFKELAGDHLMHAKSTWAGFALRRSLLLGVGIVIPDDLGPAGVTGMDDVLDAAIAAWSAERIASGTARTLPAEAPPSMGGNGVIWY